MKFGYFITCLLAEGIAGIAIKSPRHPGTACQTTGRAVYLITNDQVNAVVALPIAADGTLSQGTVTASGGNGSNSIDGTTMEAAAPDALVGQSALTIAGQNIFAVNAGSNSLSMLSISATDPTQLSLIGQPMPVPGEFPNTVAASAKHSIACVAMTGAVAGISCAPFSRSQGLGAMDALRAFDLGQTTPPVGPTNTISHIFADADASAFVTMVKGDPATNKTGFVSVLPVEDAASSSCAGKNKAVAAAAEDVRSSPAGTAVLFGSQNVPGQQGRVFATDASFGAAVLSLDAKTGTASVVGKGTIDGQKATCWSAFSPATGTMFVSDVGVPRLVEMSAENASIISTVDLSAGGDPGFIDLEAAGGFLYALSPGNGTTDAAIVVMDVSGGQGTATPIQRFSLDGVAGKNAQGMAILK
ncbi:hypothetical protein F5Y15DRAFT_417415 [Xylariaceae sp. FL0016]|nr:hypothetical protein F5Y15DRAFT_417415 [Xylariaceae sp. FL0016]